jgi:hypothetical protein
LSASASAGVVLCVEKVARHRQQLQRRRSVPLFSGPASLDRNQRFQCTIKNTQCLYYAGSFLGVRLRSRPFVIAKAHVSTTRLSTTAAPCSACYPCRGGAATRLFLSVPPIPVVFRNIVATDAFFGGCPKADKGGCGQIIAAVCSAYSINSSARATSVTSGCILIYLNTASQM